MNKAIIVSNNEVLNSIYEINLKAYVDLQVTIIKSFENLITTIENDNEIKLIICCCETKSNKDALKSFYKKLQNFSAQIPLILLGDFPSELCDILIPNRYDLKSLVKTCANILELTAKEMANKVVPKYFEIPIQLLDLIDKAPCEIYFRAAVDRVDEKYNYFVIIEKSFDINLEKYKNEGIDYLFIDSNERLRFISQASKLIISDLERKDLSVSERVEVTSKGMIVVAEEIFDNPIVTDSISEISKSCISSIDTIVSSNPKLKSLLENFLAIENEYIFTRTVITSYIASSLIKNLSWGSIDQIEKVSFALFFHDIYLVNIFRKFPDELHEQDLLYRNDIEEKDKEIILNHAKMASELVVSFPKAPMGSDVIICQHHGMTSGVGFAVNYKDDISPLAKIMIIAEDITINIIDQFYIKKISKQKILDKEIIQKRLLEKYKNHTYKKIIKTIEKISL